METLIYFIIVLFIYNFSYVLEVFGYVFFWFLSHLNIVFWIRWFVFFIRFTILILLILLDFSVIFIVGDILVDICEEYHLFSDKHEQI